MKLMVTNFKTISIKHSRHKNKGRRAISPREVSYSIICLPNYDLILDVPEIKVLNLFLLKLKLTTYISID